MRCGQIRVAPALRQHCCTPEADEVTIRGKKIKRAQRIRWWQYCGMMRREARKSLILSAMPVKTTKFKRSGKGKGSSASPGAITKVEWKRIGGKYLKWHKVLLHTDGAQAHCFQKIPDQR